MYENNNIHTTPVWNMFNISQREPQIGLGVLLFEFGLHQSSKGKENY